MNTRNHCTLLVIVFFMTFFYSVLFAGTARGQNTPELTVSMEYAQEGNTTWAVLWLDMRKEYHTYAYTSEPTSMPTTLAFAVSNIHPIPHKVYYPQGHRERDIFSPSKMVHVYRGKLPFFVDMGTVPAAYTAQGTLELLLCSDKHCLPVKRPVALQVPDTELPDIKTQPYYDIWCATVKEQISPRDGASPPDTEAFAVSTSVQMSEGTGEGEGEGHEQDSVWLFSPRSAQEDYEVESMGKALLLGLLAGLLLNVMPCVLPVLTLKASAMLVVGSGNVQERLRQFRIHNVLFAAGIWTLFLVLALILGSAGLIWGQLFQNRTLVTSILIIVFLLSLSMLGLFTLPMIDLKAGKSTSPYLNAYLTGIMATFLATPCSGPLLGGVLGWAFVQPIFVLVIVFLAVGLGMSVPYMLFAIRPSLVTFLPRPGKWMEFIEKAVGFFLLGTCIYLLSILPQENHLALLGALLVVAVGGWIWGHFGGFSAPLWRRRLLGVGLVVLTVGVMHYASQPPLVAPDWQEFAPASFRQSLGKEPLLVEFTADWCPNCKYIERTVLTNENLMSLQQRYGLRLVRVDLTRHDPAGQAFLQALGSSSIPLTALFPTGLSASSPVVLRDIYSVDALKSALRKAFPAK